MAKQLTLLGVAITYVGRADDVIKASDYKISPFRRAYWEHRGPKDWQLVRLVTRYGPGRGEPVPPFPLVHTGTAGPRNVAIRRANGHIRVLPVRNLRREQPC